LWINATKIEKDIKKMELILSSFCKICQKHVGSWKRQEKAKKMVIASGSKPLVLEF